MRPGQLSFEPLQRADFGLLATWLAEPLVARWWHDDSTIDAIERDFGPGVDGADVTEYFVVRYSGRPAGLIQRYPIAAYPEYLHELARVYPVPPGAMSIDYLVGDPNARGYGFGAGMIAALVETSWAACPGADDVLVAVATGNTRSWRALERAGFTRVAEGRLEPDNPADPWDHVVYRIHRRAAHHTARALC